jgi:Right handed beta helix region
VVSNVSQTGFTISCSASDEQSCIGNCQGQYDTDNDNAVSGGDASALIDGSMQGNNCVTTFAGLTAGTAYEAVCKVTNGVGMVTTSAVVDQTTTSAGTTVYIAPTGSDTTGTGTTGNPWKSLVHACATARLPVGGTIVMKNGTYVPQGTLSSTNCRDGQVAAPITIKAENRYMAHIQGDATATETLFLNTLHYYVIDGLRISNLRSTAARAHALHIANSANLTIKRNLIHGSNRTKNGHLIWASTVNNSLFEDNELVNFHRHGIDCGPCNNNTFRRNYINSWLVDDQTGDYLGHQTYRISDEIIVTYPGSNNLWENNILERGEVGIGLNPLQQDVDNRILHNISIDSHFCLWTQCRVYWERDATFKGNVCYNTRSGEGMARFETPVNLDMANNTFHTTFQAGAGGFNTPTGPGVCQDNPQDGIGTFSLTSVNDLFLNIQGTAMKPGPTNGGTVNWTINYPGLWNNGAHANVALTDARITNEVVANPALVTPVCIPRGTPMAGTGQGGADIGANVIKAMVNGVLTTTNLWSTTKPDAAFANSTSGRYFIGCGPKVTGVNDLDSADEKSCWKVADRLLITTTALNNCVGGTY